jgi:NAD(P)-dependent dehydrogenase (short-subunit alcohol dehydrogenase family)
VPDAKVKYESLDLASLASIADFAQRMHSRKALDLLINNAGVMALPRRVIVGNSIRLASEVESGDALG